MLGVDSERRFPAKRFAWPGVERERNGIELILGVDRQVGALWHVLPQQAVGVLVGAALPRAVRIGKVDLHAGALGQGLVAMHLAALVVGHRLAQRRQLPVEDSGEAVDDRARAGIVDLGQHHETGRALDQRAHRRAVAFTLDQVAFPVAGDEAVLDLGWTDVDALHVLDLALVQIMDKGTLTCRRAG